ncbi:MAG: AAA domain-containing protein [Acidimicrobiales bacterium]
MAEEVGEVDGGRPAAREDASGPTRPGATTMAEVLETLADLAPHGTDRAADVSIPIDWFQWLPLGAATKLLTFSSWVVPGPAADSDHVPGGGQLAQVVSEVVLGDRAEAPSVPIDGALGDQLAAVDLVRPEQRPLRIGWLFLAGHALVDGRRRKVLVPLVTVPVRVKRGLRKGAAQLVPAGDAELTSLVPAGTDRRRLEGNLAFGGGALADERGEAVSPAMLRRLRGLEQFAREAALAAGFDVDHLGELVPAGPGPDELVDRDGLVVVAGAAVYAHTEGGGWNRAEGLRRWAASTDDRWTALHALYLDRPDPPTATATATADDAHHRARPGRHTDPPGPSGPDRDPVSSFPLTPSQRRALADARHRPVTVIAGAPGTGKSHTVVAIAHDTLARGGSVLLASRTDASIDALVDLFERSPGPRPVVFGSNERRRALAEHLAAGQAAPAPAGSCDEARAVLAAAVERRNGLRSWIAERLAAEALAALPPWEADEARRLAPGLFDPSVDLDAVARLVVAATGDDDDGWLDRRRRRHALDDLLAVSGAHGGDDRDALRRGLAAALGHARAAQVRSRLEAEGGLRLDGAWDDLAHAEDEVRSAYSAWLALDARSETRRNRTTLPAVAALGTALRSGRAARREHLAALGDGAALTTALPLWAGTLADIEDLLPPRAGLFDLVILDEASSIDQPLAVGALARGARCVVVGDPNQLRHVSFLGDDEQRAALARHGITDGVLAARLDVRRNSAFDVAAGVAHVHRLDEQFRSRPHLVELLRKRFYGGHMAVATRTPRTHGIDAIDVRRLDAKRDRDGVVHAEVRAVVDELRHLRQRGATSVGVVSPFRAQAEAIEAAVLGSFRTDDLEALDLRIGTVHAMQGNERDVVIASLGIGRDDTSAWRFVQDPHLFCVLATRARDELVVLVSAEPPAGGLAADYLAQADQAPGPPPPADSGTPWSRRIGDAVADTGVAVRTAYPSGRHVVDVAAGDDLRFVGIVCGVHPDGPEAHIDRHLELRRAGWPLTEAFASRWGDAVGEAAVELTRTLRRDDPPR